MERQNTTGMTVFGKRVVVAVTFTLSLLIPLAAQWQMSSWENTRNIQYEDTVGRLVRAFRDEPWKLCAWSPRDLGARGSDGLSAIEAACLRHGFVGHRRCIYPVDAALRRLGWEC